MKNHGEMIGMTRHISIMQVKMRISLQMGDSPAVIHRGTADYAMHIIALFQQQLRQKGTILTGHAGNQCFLHFYLTPR